jgi:formylglycine-generating enzyme required for sulfatase activity
MRTAIRHPLFTAAATTCMTIAGIVSLGGAAFAQQPAQGQIRTVELGNNVSLEVLYLPPGEFMMGSTPEERAWATGIEGGATPGTTRESFEGEARLTRIRHGLWMARTEVSVGQFRRFVEDSGYVTDAEKPGGKTQCFDPSWTGYKLTTSVVHPWSPMPGKSWRDPNWAFPQQDNFPVVCVSWNDGRAFCRWLTDRERAAGRLGTDLEYRLPTDAEWEYACRGGKPRAYFWWGNELEDGEGRLNISAIDLLPGRTRTWPLAKAPWSDGYAFVSPVDHYGERGRNGFGLADMCGGVWEVVLDHFDPKGGHEEPIFNPADPHPVCRGGNYFDVPGNARCAVRLGLQSDSYSDSRDGFRICLGKPITVPEKAGDKQ